MDLQIEDKRIRGNDVIWSSLTKLIGSSKGKKAVALIFGSWSLRAAEEPFWKKTILYVLYSMFIKI